MDFNTPLIQGKILKRYKRFFADIELPSGEIVVAHTPNTGSMKTCWEPGGEALISFKDDPKRKLKYTLEMTQANGSWVGVNTMHPNKIVYQAIVDKKIPELTGYREIKREKKIGQSRIDLYLSDEERECYVEVKNVTLKGEGTTGLFPDAVTTRGQKHLDELQKIVASGKRAVIFYLVSREDVDHFSPAKNIDPVYTLKLKSAVNAGVEVLIYQCALTPESIEIIRPLELKL